jgi:hypothetical protein
MSPVEFQEMIIESGVISKSFSYADIFPVWNLSMMTQLDEITSDKHMNMSFTEFIETIGRVSEKLAIPNLIEDAKLFQERKWEDLIIDKDLAIQWS